MKKIIIIPAYNEEKSILRVCQGIWDYNKKNKDNYDIIVINDGSKDNTEEILTKNNIPHIKLIRNLGIGGAVQTGYKYAKENAYDVAIQYDGDGQHNIEYVKDIIKPIEDGSANMVIGSRFVENIDTFKSSVARRMGIKVISFFIKLVTGKKIYDTTSGMRAVDKNIIAKFSEEYPTEYPEPISTVKVLKDGYKVLEKSAKMNERKEGVSSIRAWKNIYYMVNVVLSIILIGLRRNK